MARKKVKIEYIENKKARKQAFKRRTKGLLKKLKELSILCDVKACGIVFGPDNQEPETWPASRKDFVSMFNEMSVNSKDKKMIMRDQDSYLRERISKEQEKLRKLRAENREIWLGQVLNDFLKGDYKEFSSLNPSDIEYVFGLIERRVMIANLKINRVAKSGESSSLPPPPVAMNQNMIMDSSLNMNSELNQNNNLSFDMNQNLGLNYDLNSNQEQFFDYMVDELPGVTGEYVESSSLLPPPVAVADSFVEFYDQNPQELHAMNMDMNLNSNQNMNFDLNQTNNTSFDMNMDSNLNMNFDMNQNLGLNYDPNANKEQFFIDMDELFGDIGEYADMDGASHQQPPTFNNFITTGHITSEAATVEDAGEDVDSPPS